MKSEGKAGTASKRSYFAFGSQLEGNLYGLLDTLEIVESFCLFGGREAAGQTPGQPQTSKQLS
jgi:hypothetical protein